MRIGIITSGGDSPGMNAAIRAMTRCALDRGIEVVGIHEGWQGVVDGGAKFEPFNWRSVGGILQMGGTILGTARSDAFRTAAPAGGRLPATWSTPASTGWWSSAATAR